MAARKVEPAAKWGARPVPTLVTPPPSHHSTFHPHFSRVPVRAPSQHQVPLTMLSPPSAAG